METWLPAIENQFCTACGLCVTHCPTRAVKLIDRLPVFVKPDACTYCGLCEEICPAGAVGLVYDLQLKQDPNN